MIKDIIKFRFALWDMARRHLKANYAGSWLGLWWAVITPLLLAASIGFVFTAVFKINLPGYSLYVLSGLLPWLFFNHALSEASNSFVTQAAMAKQSMLPKVLFPVSGILANLLSFTLGLLFLFPLFAFHNWKVIWMVPILVLVLACHFLFTVGLGVLLSAANIFFKDLSHFLNIFFMVWFWVTPIFYSLDLLEPRLRWICLVNPLTPYTLLYQSILFEAKVPHLSVFIAAFLLAFAFFFAGLKFFAHKEPQLLKRI